MNDKMILLIGAMAVLYFWNKSKTQEDRTEKKQDINTNRGNGIELDPTAQIIGAATDAADMLLNHASKMTDAGYKYRLQRQAAANAAINQLNLQSGVYSPSFLRLK